MDPSRGHGCCSTASTCGRSRHASLRRSVVLVPQEGFLFDDTLARERALRHGWTPPRPTSSPAPTSSAWATGSPGCRAGLATRVGPARRVALGGRAAAGRAAARAPRRPRPAGPRRGHQRGRPGAGDADRPGAGAADERAHLGHHRAPAVHRGERRRGRRRRPGRIVQRGPHARAGRRRTACTPGCTPRGWPSRAPDGAGRLTGSRGSGAARPRTSTSVWRTCRSPRRWSAGCGAGWSGVGRVRARPDRSVPGDVEGAVVVAQEPQSERRGPQVRPALHRDVAPPAMGLQPVVAPAQRRHIARQVGPSWPWAVMWSQSASGSLGRGSRAPAWCRTGTHTVTSLSTGGLGHPVGDLVRR